MGTWVSTLHTHGGRLEIEVVVNSVKGLRPVRTIVWPFIRYHCILWAHLQDALVLHDLVNECAIVLEVVDVVVFELIEECQLLLDQSARLNIVWLHVSANLTAL